MAVPVIKAVAKQVIKALKQFEHNKIMVTSLDTSLAESIVNSVSSDRIIIVCKDAERDVVISLLSQIGWKSHIQSIVTESDLISWYEKALRGCYSDVLGDELLYCLAQEIVDEFPSVDTTPDIIRNRHYERINAIEVEHKV